MRKSVLIALIAGVVAFVAAGLYLIITCVIMKDKDYDDFNTESNSPYYSEVVVRDKEDGYPVIEGNANDEESVIANYLISNNLKGSIMKLTMDTVGEGEVPEIVQKYDAKVWYNASTNKGPVFFIFVEGRLISSLEE